MGELDFAIECLKVSFEIVKKMPEFEKRHPNTFEKEDAIKMADDLGLATVYPGFLDYETIRYLKSKKIRLIEVPPEEFIEYGCNGLILEPGKVMVPAAAKETIKALRKEGVVVIDVDFSENAASGGGGPNCITGKLLRDPGPQFVRLIKQGYCLLPVLQ